MSVKSPEAVQLMQRWTRSVTGGDSSHDTHVQVEAAIENEVARRLEMSGADFKRWPRAARDEVARLGVKLEAAQGLIGTLHAEVDAAAQQHQSEAVARAQLQV